MKLRTSWIGLALLLIMATVAHAVDYLPGDIFVTRNAEESENTSPGHWNHMAIYVGQNQVVEAQVDQGVIYSDLAEFIARYSEILVLRLREGDGQLMADAARQYVKNPYNRLGSLPFRLRPPEQGDNCVSLMRRCYIAAKGRDPRWRIPDRAVRDHSLCLFQTLCQDKGRLAQLARALPLQGRGHWFESSIAY